MPEPVHGKICYLEIPATDVQASAKFYQEVFALGEPVWQYTPDPVTNSNLSPEIRVYQLRPSTSRAAPN